MILSRDQVLEQAKYVREHLTNAAHIAEELNGGIYADSIWLEKAAELARTARLMIAEFEKAQ